MADTTLIDTWCPASLPGTSVFDIAPTDDAGALPYRVFVYAPPGEAPEAMEKLAQKIKAADAFVFVTGEYNWGPQPGLKNLTDHFLEEWFWRPAAIASYSAGRIAGARSSFTWHGILNEMGMIVVSISLAVGPIADTFDA